MTWTGIRIRDMDHLNNFEAEEILWNQSEWMNPKQYFIWKEERFIIKK